MKRAALLSLVTLLGCSAPVEETLDAPAELDAKADGTHKNALFLAPELAFDRASSAAGKLGDEGGLRALVAEALAKLGDDVGGATVDSIGSLVVVSHSGGYQAAAAIAVRGGVPVSE